MFRPQGNGGKGDAPRPTDWDKFSNNFDAIFKKKEKNEQGSTAPQDEDNSGSNLES